MSADIYVWAVKRVKVASVNITYNLGPMLREAGMEWTDFSELKPPELARRITTTINELEARPETYRRLNPANGWGSFEYLIKSLREVLEALNDPENLEVTVSTWL